MRCVALIPARGGSKGVPGKNIRLLNGKPLIAYAIEAAKASKSLDRIIVSTDYQDIADVAVDYGAEVPFLRPEELSGDSISDFPVMAHLVDWLNETENYQFDVLLYLRPTTPFKTGQMIDEIIEQLREKSDLDSVRSVTHSEGPFHPYWMYNDDNGILKPFIAGIDIKKYFCRQVLPECLRLNGVVDAIRVDVLMAESSYGNKMGKYIVPEQCSIDIDTELDFTICEVMMGKNKSGGL